MKRITVVDVSGAFLKRSHSPFVATHEFFHDLIPVIEKEETYEETKILPEFDFRD